MSARTISLVLVHDEGELYEVLDQGLNANGIVPHLAACDADETPLLLWLDEHGGDEVVLRAAALHIEDGGTTSTPSPVPLSVIAFPVALMTTSEWPS